MKLIFCPECEDVRKILYDMVTCECGESWGKYHNDGLNAEYGGQAVPMGFDNPQMMRALNSKTHSRSRDLLGFDAFFIANDCKTYTKVEAGSASK